MRDLGIAVLVLVLLGCAIVGHVRLFRYARLVPLLLLAVTLTSCNGSQHHRNDPGTTGLGAHSDACRRDPNQEVLVGQTRPGVPWPMQAGQAVWFRFPSPPNAIYRWSRPVSSAPKVAEFAPVVRCGNGFVAELHARTVGASILGATSSPTSPNPPSFAWQVKVIVTEQDVSRIPPPSFSSLIRAGGLLVYPRHLGIDGTDATFQVPRVPCINGHPFNLDVGAFGVARLVPAVGRARLAPWFVGLTVTCTRTGTATYRVGYDHRPLRPVQPGWTIDVGADAIPTSPSLGITTLTPNSGNESDYFGPTPAQAERGSIVEPIVLLGAHVTGALPEPFHLALAVRGVNDEPYRLAPHRLIAQTSRSRTAVAPHTSPNWYRLALAIG